MLDFSYVYIIIYYTILYNKKGVIYLLKIFILFFLLIYIACELTKFNKLEGIKKKYSERVYNTPVVYIKIVALIITIVLTLINRCTKEGNLEKSGGIRGLLIMCLFSTETRHLSVFCCIFQAAKKGKKQE